MEGEIGLVLSTIFPIETNYAFYRFQFHEIVMRIVQGAAPGARTIA